MREFSSSQVMCTVVIVSSLKGRAHGKARLRTIVTWNALDSDWLETRYAPYLPPEPQVPCLSKCLVIKSHYDDLLMVSFFPHILAVHVRTGVCEYMDAKSLRPRHLAIGSLSNDDGDVNENGKKAMGLD